MASWRLVEGECAPTFPVTSFVQTRQLRDALLESRFVRDRVAPVDALGLVADELRRHRPRDAGPLEVPDGRALEVVEPGALARRLSGAFVSRLPHGLARLSVPMEYVGDDHVPLVLHRVGPPPLTPQQLLKWG